MLLKVLIGFFTVLGVIFFILIILGLYGWYANVFGLRTAWQSSGLSIGAMVNIATGNNGIKANNVDKNPLLSAEQEAKLESLGIDPAKLPSTITPAMEVCFNQKLGIQRTNEIKQGSSPTAEDFLKAQSCLN